MRTNEKDVMFSRANCTPAFLEANCGLRYPTAYNVPMRVIGRDQTRKNAPSASRWAVTDSTGYDQGTVARNSPSPSRTGRAHTRVSVVPISWETTPAHAL